MNHSVNQQIFYFKTLPSSDPDKLCLFIDPSTWSEHGHVGPGTCTLPAPDTGYMDSGTITLPGPDTVCMSSGTGAISGLDTGYMDSCTSTLPCPDTVLAQATLTLALAPYLVLTQSWHRLHGLLH